MHTKLYVDIDKELHDLCQPLTNLSCFLEVGQRTSDAYALRMSVDSALIECHRMFECVETMRRRLAEFRAEENALHHHEAVPLYEEKASL